MFISMSKSFWFFVFLKCSWMWFILLVFEMGIFTTIHIFKLRMCYSGNGLLDGGSDHEQVPTPKHRPVHRGLLWETPKVKLDDDDYIGILWESYWDIVMIILGYYDRVKNDDDDDDDYIGILWGVKNDDKIGHFQPNLSHWAANGLRALS